MLTQEEIKQIIEAQREVFATKNDIIALQEEMRKDFSDVLTAKVANKLGIRLEY
ncbi:MAG: hypothetical protein HYW98_00450 [Candidatus Wildermuthbacteria bacterium]|nr:hypothetical protein [Candidatus Wildermuthbacteria bacterium]